MSETPKTDALHEAFLAREGFCLDDIIEAYDHAFELERENARLRELLLQSVGRIRAEISGEYDLQRIHTSAESIIAALPPNTQPANKPSVAFGPKRP